MLWCCTVFYLCTMRGLSFSWTYYTIRLELDGERGQKVLTRAMDAVHWLKHRFMQSSFLADDSLLHFKLQVVMQVCLLSSTAGSTTSVGLVLPPVPVLPPSPVGVPSPPVVFVVSVLPLISPPVVAVLSVVLSCFVWSDVSVLVVVVVVLPVVDGVVVPV